MFGGESKDLIHCYKWTDISEILLGCYSPVLMATGGGASLGKHVSMTFTVISAHRLCCSFIISISETSVTAGIHLDKVEFSFLFCVNIKLGGEHVVIL